MFRSSVGVPVTSTVSLSDTWTWIVSPTVYEPFALVAVTFVTVGGVASKRKVRVVVPTSQEKGIVWHYTFDKPKDGWQKPGFDDTGWKEGPGGFGGREPRGTSVGTPWRGNDVWIRRSFKLDSVPAGDLFARIFHDEDAEVYINGQLAAKVEGFNTSYHLVACDGSPAKLLHAGYNVIAVHCRQTTGGQYIDVGLATILEKTEGATTAQSEPAAIK